jgi:hypothetical protein
VPIAKLLEDIQNGMYKKWALARFFPWIVLYFYCNLGFHGMCCLYVCVFFFLFRL